MVRLFSGSSLVIVLAAVCPFAVSAVAKNAETDWPRFRGAAGDGISHETGLLKEWPKDGPPLVWKSDPIGIGFSSVSMAGPRIFTMGDDKKASWVFALDRNTGKMLWSAKVGKDGGNYKGPRCTPTVDGDFVYAIGQFGDLVCLDAATGNEKWRKNFGKDFGGEPGGWNYTESPLIDGARLVCTPGGKDKGAMVALDKKTGAVIWGSDFGETAGYASIITTEAGGVRQYVQLLSQGVAGVSAQDGKLLWRFRDKDGKKSYFAGNTANIPNPVALGSYVFAGAGYGRGAGLMKLVGNGSAIKEQWIYFKQELNSRHGGYVVVGDYVYADRDDSGEPFCARWKTGEIQWKRSSNYEGQGSVSIVYADGRLYMHYANGYVALVEASPQAYKEHGVFKIPGATSNSWAHPVVAGGKLYLRDKDVLWCYDVRAK
jgi:outer membrane protein assembly factor BamB